MTSSAPLAHGPQKEATTEAVFCYGIAITAGADTADIEAIFASGLHPTNVLLLLVAAERAELLPTDHEATRSYIKELRHCCETDYNRPLYNTGSTLPRHRQRQGEESELLTAVTVWFGEHLPQSRPSPKLAIEIARLDEYRVLDATTLYVDILENLLTSLYKYPTLSMRKALRHAPEESVRDTLIWLQEREPTKRGENQTKIFANWVAAAYKYLDPLRYPKEHTALLKEHARSLKNLQRFAELAVISFAGDPRALHDIITDRTLHAPYRDYKNYTSQASGTDEAPPITWDEFKYATTTLSPTQQELFFSLLETSTVDATELCNTVRLLTERQTQQDEQNY